MQTYSSLSPRLKRRVLICVLVIIMALLLNLIVQQTFSGSPKAEAADGAACASAIVSTTVMIAATAVAPPVAAIKVFGAVASFFNSAISLRSCQTGGVKRAIKRYWDWYYNGYSCHSVDILYSDDSWYSLLHPVIIPRKLSGGGCSGSW